MNTTLRLVSVLLIFGIAVFNELRAQECGATEFMPYDTSFATIGGASIPSGHITPATIKALVICIEFPEDAEDTSGSTATGPNTHPWPYGNKPLYIRNNVSGESDIIDYIPTGYADSGRKYSITTYFREMSSGKLTIYGEAYYVKTTYPLSFYLRDSVLDSSEAQQYGHPEDAGEKFNGNPAFFSLKHAMRYLDSLHGSNGSFYTAFDNWTFHPYSHTNTPDGIIDLVLSVYRTKNGLPGQDVDGISALYYDHSPFKVTGPGGDSIVVYSGSGVKITRGRDYPRFLFEIICHEIGHYLLGPYHQYMGGMWSIVGQRNLSPCNLMNSYERFLMGWLDFKVVQVTDSQ